MPGRRYDSDSVQGRFAALLAAHRPGYVPEKEACRALGVAGPVVERYAAELEGLGYAIDRDGQSRYRMARPTGLLLPWEIADGLETDFVGGRIQYFDSIGSTQDHAVEIAPHSRSGTVIVARTQTHGRGRVGRKWVSPPGGVWLSVILHPEFGIEESTMFPLGASVALSRALGRTEGLATLLKWPNDVMLNGRKVAGILTDAAVRGSGMEHLVVGAGINYGVDAAGIEAGLEGARAASIAGGSGGPRRLVQAFLAEIERICRMMESGDLGGIAQEWTARSCTIGERVSFETAGKVVTGTASGIDRAGALMVSSGGRIHRMVAGGASYRDALV